MNKDSVPAALILNPPELDHWVLGSGKATERFGEGELNPSGDWTPYKTEDEEQRRFGFETYNCSVYGTIKAWVMLAKLHGFKDFPSNASEAYVGVHAGTTPNGNDPHKVGEVARKECGLIPQMVMPWTEDINTWDEYYNRKMAFSLLPFGKKLLQRFELGQEWVFPWGNNLETEVKHKKIKEAIKRGPVALSVDGRYRKKGKYYTKNKGDQDTHWVTLLRFDGDHPVIHDQYPPFIKTLAKDYDFNVAKVYFLKRREQIEAKTFWDVIWDNFAKLWKR